jgi:hypothetical protein
MLAQNYISLKVKVSCRLRDLRHLKLFGLTETKQFALWRNVDLDLLIEISIELAPGLAGWLDVFARWKLRATPFMHLAVSREKVLLCHFFNNGFGEGLAGVFTRLVIKQASAWGQDIATVLSSMGSPFALLDMRYTLRWYKWIHTFDLRQDDLILA